MNLAHDAQSSDDRVASENYLQHAEHYFRIIAAAQAQMTSASVAMAEQPQLGESNASDDEEDDQPTENGALDSSDNDPQQTDTQQTDPQQTDQRSRRSRRRNGRGGAPGDDSGIQQPAGEMAQAADQELAEQPFVADRNGSEQTPVINGSVIDEAESSESAEGDAGVETESGTPSI